MVFRPEVALDSVWKTHARDPFDGIEVVKVLDDHANALDFIEAFELSADDDNVKSWKWHIEPHKGTYLPPDLSELMPPYQR